MAKRFFTESKSLRLEKKLWGIYCKGENVCGKDDE